MPRTVWRNLGPDWLYDGWSIMVVVFGSGLAGALLPTTAALARAVLSKLPFPKRYDWS